MGSNYALNIINSILLEQASQEYVIDAIKKKYEVDITYDDGANGVRRIQPVCYGKSDKGNMVVRAFQVEGDSRTNDEGWKLFRLDKIISWEPIKDSNFGEPPGMNTHGDESMSQVYVIADFGQGETPEETTTPSTTQQEPEYVSQPTPIQQPQTKTDNIAGLSQRNKIGDENQSKAEMRQADRFGDTNVTQTVGPITKDNAENQGQIAPEGGVDYQNIENGPVYKNRSENGDTSFIDNIKFVDDNNNKEEERENSI